MRLTRHLRWLLLAVPMALAACEDVPSSTGGSAGAVGPGPHQVDGTVASIMFSQICAQTYPNIEAARAEIVKLPFTQHPQTGTYYHRALDLSFKLTKSSDRQSCSMVFATTNRYQGALGILVSAGVGSAGIATENKIGLDPATGATVMKLKQNGTFAFRATSSTGSRVYYNAIIKKK